MSLLSPTIKTFNPTSFTLQIISCHTAAFCQKIILEFVARCRWNGKKDFWATLLRTLKNFHPTSVILLHFAGKKINFSLQNHWTDSSLRSKILNSAKSCLFKLVFAKLLICLLKLISIDFCLLRFDNHTTEHFRSEITQPR